jgi:biopolymer transport protein ExbD
MAKAKMNRGTPSIDMTPMVDLAFLLVTFFMLTASAVPDEPVAVDTPSSVSDIKIPETNVLTISIDKENRVFYNMDGQYNRQEVLAKMGELHGVQFTPEEARTFALMSTMGIPMGSMKQFLSLPPEERKAIRQPGIPADSVGNELAEWILQSRLINRKLRIAIKGDKDAGYPAVKKVMKTLMDRKVNRFNLITGMEKGAEIVVKK